jgi:endonuclease/exonuclease/phosphatase family metal-dependent hydrolase
VRNSPFLLTFVCTWGLVACVTEEPLEDDAVEDLGGLDGKADKITTRNLTLRPHLASGAPSRRTFTVTTRAAFRVSLAYETDSPTKLVVFDDSGTLAESPSTFQPTVVVPAAQTARAIKLRLEHAGDGELRVRLHVATREPRELRIATFNIRWYGLGGDVGAPVPEHRNPALRAFMADHLADADVIVFQEIIDVAMLRAELVPADWTCATYANAAPEHQFVVACHGPDFTLTREADDTDLAFQPLALGTLRPAVAGILRDRATGAPLARLVGVHLKALPSSTDTRLRQARILAERLGALAASGDELPVVMLGDFNSHRAVDTKRPIDDWTLLSEVLAPSGLVRVDYPFEHTFRDKAGKAFKLDHVWLGGATASDVDVPGACNVTDEVAIARHFDTISDHCPLIATITL